MSRESGSVMLRTGSGFFLPSALASAASLASLSWRAAMAAASSRRALRALPLSVPGPLAGHFLARCGPAGLGGGVGGQGLLESQLRDLDRGPGRDAAARDRPGPGRGQQAGLGGRPPFLPAGGPGGLQLGQPAGDPLRPGGAAPPAGRHCRAVQAQPGQRPAVAAAAGLRARLPASLAMLMALAGAALAVGPGGLVEDLAGQLAQPVLGPVRLFRRICPDLGPVDGDHVQPAQPGRRQHEQHLGEQVFQRPARPGGPGPEPADGRVIREPVPGRDPERRIGPAPVLDLPRRPLGLQVRIDQQHRQHPRVIPRPASARTAQRLQRRRVQPVDYLDHEPHQMIPVHPQPHILGQHHRLIPVHRQVFSRHKQ
jgi:hypothetical protein